MQRIALAHRAFVGGGKGSGVIKGWSVLSRPLVQRTLSSSGPGPVSGGDAGRKGDAGVQGSGQGRGQAREGHPGTREAGAGEGQNPVPAGRGRGAFSQFLRLHERNIEQHVQSMDQTASHPKGRRGRRGDSVSGQFDDSEQGSAQESPEGTILEEDVAPKEDMFLDEKWQDKWFTHEDKKFDDYATTEEAKGGDIQGLDDCEEDDRFDPQEKYDEENWKGYSEEQFKEFKILGARLEQEERQQLATLQASWEGKKRQAEVEHGSSAHLELPDIRVIHEITYEAPPGKATADRAMPLPRPLGAIVDSMELPPGLDVTPDDAEYEQVVNMWKAVSRNNTMDERMKKSVIGQISTFIAKHRHSDAFQKALQTQDFPEVKGKRPR